LFNKLLHINLFNFNNLLNFINILYKENNENKMYLEILINKTETLGKNNNMIICSIILHHQIIKF